MGTNAKPLQCPKCKGYEINVSEEFVRDRHFRIKDKHIQEIEKGYSRPTEKVWISCSDCREEENDLNPIEWEASDEEKKLIRVIWDKVTDPIDVSEFLK